MNDGWLPPILVDLLPPPPPDRIVEPGARVFAVHAPAGVEPYQWHSAVILAWAQLGNGAPACLMAWHGMCEQPEGRPRLVGRWSWCRHDRARFTPSKPTKIPNPWGLSWHGLPTTDPINDAIAEAAASLPPGMRELAPRPTPGMPRLLG